MAAQAAAPGKCYPLPHRHKGPRAVSLSCRWWVFHGQGFPPNADTSPCPARLASSKFSDCINLWAFNVSWRFRALYGSTPKFGLTTMEYRKLGDSGLMVP